MSTLQTNELLSEGTPVELAVNRPFFIHDPQRIWLVQSGCLDLFLVNTTSGEPSGARQHFLRAQAGQAVFGLKPDSNQNIGLLAVISPGTVLVIEDIENLRDAVEKHPSLIPLLDVWIEQLGISVSTKIVPKKVTVLQAGREVTVQEGATALAPVEGVLWVRQRAGQSRLLGNTALPPVEANSVPFPVSKYGWLEATPKSQLDAFTSGSLTEVEGCWEGLQEFHQNILYLLIINQRAEEEREIARLQTQQAEDDNRVDLAFLGLAAPLNGKISDISTDSVSSDPLLLACQAVGNAIGIKLRAPSEMLAGQKVRDPIAAIAKTSKVRVRRVMLKDKWWTKDSGAVLVFRDSDSRPLALLPQSPTKYSLYDPQNRSTIRVNAAVAHELNGFAFTFYRPFPPVKLRAKDMLAFGAAKGHKDLWIILLMGVASGLLAMVTPIATGIVFDSVIPGAELPALLALTIFLVVSAISTALFNVARSVATLRLEGKMDASIQAAVWDRLLSLPVPFFRNYSSGDLAIRSLGINQIRRTLTGSTLSSILSGFFSLFSFALLYYYSWRLANLAGGLILLAFAVSMALGYWQIAYQRDMSKVRGRISGMLLQFIVGISKLRVSGTENRAFVAWARQFAAQRELSAKARNTSNHLTVFFAGYPVLCTAGIFMYTAYLLKQPGVAVLTTGEFLAFNAAFGQFLTAMLQLSSSIVSVLSIVPLYERAKPILESLPEVDAEKSSPGELAGFIELNHVSFRYRPDTPLILRDVSISILPGQFVAFVGASGSGKSTLLRLLLGFEVPESGAVYYDGQDLAGLDVQAVRQQMGVVLQNARLLSGDIYLNIVGSAPLTIDDAWEAAKLSGFDQDIRMMPMGMHTVISEGGGGLSGGQRQRLLIARAIVGKPRIVLFDEATSALDNQTQATVSKSLELLQATRIVIAHRLSTIVNADRIFVVDKGAVVQSGTYDELIENEGPFQDLAKRQLV